MSQIGIVDSSIPRETLAPMPWSESDAIQRLRRLAGHPAALGLRDDAALLGDLVITHDTIAEGVHFLPTDPAASVGWKLAAVNLSDLAAKGAAPIAGLLSLTLSGDGEWEAAFIDGLEAACESYGLPLIGGDTIRLPAGAPRVLGITAIGRAGERVPRRDGAKPGDGLWLIGTVGDSAAGLAQLMENKNAGGPLVDVYRRPIPLLAAGQAVARHAQAMMDVSDGLLLDARRMAQASGCAVTIEIDRLPLSAAFIAERGHQATARMFAATGGDDYALLVAMPAETDIATLSLPTGTKIVRIGSFGAGEASLSLTSSGSPVELPERLGFEHSESEHRTVGNRGHAAAPVADRR